ncbi:hypothetical protein JTB14_022392 [Gonioctena quinquepunctata]|nr:hypothetical protein JTB14_022392 [Gonioctena quinquepunctata]
MNLKHVFQRLRESNLKLQLEKTECLRHIIATVGKPNSYEINAILNYPMLKTAREIKGSFGFLGYYIKLMKNITQITFTNCMKKGAKIDINNPTYIRTFEDSKALLTNDQILQYSDFTKDFNLTTDASNVAICTVLSQGPIGHDKLIGFASRTQTKLFDHRKETFGNCLGHLLQSTSN